MDGKLPALPWLEPPEALQVLRILQEALANVLKHARASVVRIDARKVERDGHSGVLVSIADNGMGYDMGYDETRHGGRGLGNMRDRARRLGAELRIETEAGTRVEVFLPLNPSPPQEEH
ncbi:MAG: hypothetical protein Q8Q28_13185 [Pseudomonadota bacterium]|nr:hypothetical protein [Pseudomonadota bacterium]